MRRTEKYRKDEKRLLRVNDTLIMAMHYVDFLMKKVKIAGQ